MERRLDEELVPRDTVPVPKLVVVEWWKDCPCMKHILLPHLGCHPDY